MLIVQNKKKLKYQSAQLVCGVRRIYDAKIMQRGVTGVSKVLSVVSVDSGCNSVE